MNTKTCWLTGDTFLCKRNDGVCDDCDLFHEKFSKIVYCSDDTCPHYRKMPEKKIIKYHKDYVPLCEDSGFTGVCDRKEVGVEHREIVTPMVRYNLAECKTHSKIKIDGHQDFSKLTPQFVGADEVKDAQRKQLF